MLEDLYSYNLSVSFERAKCHNEHAIATTKLTLLTTADHQPFETILRVNVDDG
jgi:hypothetical protein